MTKTLKCSLSKYLIVVFKFGIIKALEVFIEKHLINILYKELSSILYEKLVYDTHKSTWDLYIKRNSKLYFVGVIYAIWKGKEWS